MLNRLGNFDTGKDDGLQRGLHTMARMETIRKQHERDLLADASEIRLRPPFRTHLLRRGLADAYIAGSLPRFDGAIVQSHSLPYEPWCFGTDPDVLWHLLRRLNGVGTTAYVTERFC